MPWASHGGGRYITAARLHLVTSSSDSPWSVGHSVLWLCAPCPFPFGASGENLEVSDLQAVTSLFSPDSRAVRWLHVLHPFPFGGSQPGKGQEERSSSAMPSGGTPEVTSQHHEMLGVTALSAGTVCYTLAKDT